MYWIGFVLVIVTLLILIRRYRSLYLKEKQNKVSTSVKYGKFLEQYIPWIRKIFPYNPERFRFIGNPIDGILFDENKIIFLEFKTGKSKLNQTQRKIKSLVENKRVEWKEIRVE